MTSGSPIAGRSTVEPLGGRIAIDARGDGALTLFGRQARSIRGDTCLDERAAAGDEAREDTCPSLNSGAPEELKVLLLLVGRGVAKEDHDESVGTLERLCHPFGGPWWTVKGRGGVEVTDLRLVKGFEGELRGWGGAGGVGWAAGQVDCSRRETARRARAEEGQPCIRMMKSEAPDGFVKVGRDMRRTLLLMLFLLPASSLARDPPRISVREALARGDTAFIGRVVALEELKPNVITPRPWEDADLLATMADIAVELDALRRERAGVPPRGVRLEVEFVRASLRRSERPIHFDFGLRPQTKLCLRIEKEGYAPTACQRGTEVPASRARIFDENAPTIVEAQVRFDDEKRLVAVSFIEPIVDDSNWFGPYDVWFLVDAGSDELIAGCIPGYGRADIKAPARHAGEKMSRSCMPFYVRLPDGSAVPWRMAPPEELE